MTSFFGAWFNVLFCAAYIAAFVFERPLVYYYPVSEQWSLTLLGPEAGTVMHWYGLIAGALLPALTGALVLRGVRCPGVLGQAALPASMLTCVYLLRSYAI